MQLGISTLIHYHRNSINTEKTKIPPAKPAMGRLHQGSMLDAFDQMCKIVRMQVSNIEDKCSRTARQGRVMMQRVDLN